MLFGPGGEERHARALENRGGNRGGNQPLGDDTASSTASRLSSPPSPSVTRDTADWLRASELEAHDRDPRLAKFVYQTAGLLLDNTLVQTWHVGEQQLQVAVWPDESLRYVLRISSGWPAAIKRHHSQQPPTGLALAEVYAISTAKRLHLPRGPELARWKRKALVDAGIVEPHPVQLAPLPPDAPNSARQTWHAIAGLLQVRFLVDPPDEPVPISSPFLSSWSGMPQSTLERGKRWLEPHGYITRVGHAPFGSPAPCLLWHIATSPNPDTRTGA